MATSGYKWSICGWMLLLFLGLVGFSEVDHASADRNLLHPFYVSVTEIEYNAQTKTLEISCKMFSEDLEKALTKAFHTSVDIYHPKNTAVLEQQLAQYLQPQLLLKVDGKPLPMQMIGHELEAQSTYCYFEVTGVQTAPKKIDVVNKILQEMNNNQINIVHVMVGGNRKSTKLDFPATDASFLF